MAEFTARFNDGKTARTHDARVRLTPGGLDIYNALGQNVASLVQGTRQAGSYALHWDGRDQSGAPAASGIYHYRLVDSAGQVQARKLLLLR